MTKMIERTSIRRRRPHLEFWLLVSLPLLLNWAVMVESFTHRQRHREHPNKFQTFQRKAWTSTATSTQTKTTLLNDQTPKTSSQSSFLSLLSAQIDDKNDVVVSSSVANSETDSETKSDEIDVRLLIQETFRDRTAAGALSVQLVTLELPDHQPMGCTVEESLDEADEYVFVSRITKDSNAEKSGMKVGDVIVAMTGPFGTDCALSVVLDAGVEKIKRMASAVPHDETLVIQVVRGTDVLERHEKAVVDICSLSESGDSDVEDCVVKFLADGYYEDIGGSSSKTVDKIQNSDVVTDVDLADDADGLIDNMMNMWVKEDDLPLPPSTSGITDGSNQQQNKKPKPWSSRSSPSGTYVRDPKTGEMRNIDA